MMLEVKLIAHLVTDSFAEKCLYLGLNLVLEFEST